MNAIAIAAVIISLFAAIGAITGLYVLVLLGLRARAWLESADEAGADHGNPSRPRQPRQGDAMRPSSKASPNLASLHRRAARPDGHHDARTNLE
jgi:hypothetical protein